MLLGLLIGFYGGVNNLLHLIRLATQDTGNQYYYGISLSQGFTEAVFWLIVGVLSIIIALAFRKDKHWAAFALPLPPVILFLYIVYLLSSSTKTELAWTGGIMTMTAIVLLAFVIIEISYLSLRKNTQMIQQNSSSNTVH